MRVKRLLWFLLLVKMFWWNSFGCWFLRCWLRVLRVIWKRNVFKFLFMMLCGCVWGCVWIVRSCRMIWMVFRLWVGFWMCGLFFRMDCLGFKWLFRCSFFFCWVLWRLMVMRRIFFLMSWLRRCLFLIMVVCLILMICSSGWRFCRF